MLDVQLAPKLHFTEGADSRYQLINADGIIIDEGLLVEGSSKSITYRSDLPTLFELESRVYYCDEKQACRADNALFEIELKKDIESETRSRGTAVRLVQNIPPVP